MDFTRLCPGVRGHKAIHDCLDADKVKDLSPECREAQPCLEDRVRFCRGAEGPKEHHSCMLKHNTSLSPTCQAAMKECKRHRAQPMDDDDCRCILRRVCMWHLCRTAQGSRPRQCT